jgi:light-independent protochlorophyllide reductase subunit N
VLNYSGSGIETTFTQGEDACLAALVPTIRAGEDAPALMVVGALPMWWKISSRLFAILGIGKVVRCRPARRRDAGVGPTPNSAGAAFLADTGRRSKSAARGASPALFPLGAEGTTAWLQAAAQAFGVAGARFEP